MAEEIFQSDHLVIITSKIQIDAVQWRNYMVDNQNKWIRKNARILILTGIHGSSDGKLGPADYELVEDYEDQVDLIKRRYQSEIEENNIEFLVQDLGPFLSCESDEKVIIETY